MNIKVEQTETETTIPIGRVVGRINNEYYYLERVFSHETLGGLQGAVGTIFNPVPNNVKEERMSKWSLKENWKSMWEDLVYQGGTEQGLDDFVEGLTVEDVFDLSEYDLGRYIAEIYNSEHDLAPVDEGEIAEFSECTGAGRIFSNTIEFDKVYNPEALDLAVYVEWGHKILTRRNYQYRRLTPGVESLIKGALNKLEVERDFRF